MPSSSLNPPMDKAKPRRSETLAPDESALAKSAAWAWYERGSGSGSDARSFREVDAWRAKLEPRPSRYKLEASRNVQHHQSRRSCSLLDVYEIERISRQLDRYIESSRDKYGGEVAAAAERKIKSVEKKKKEVGKGNWLRRGDDVAEKRGFEGRRPGKGRVAVVVEVGCRPRRPWGIRV